MKKIFIVILLLITTFNFYAQTFDQCTDKKLLSIYEEGLQRDLNDDKLILKEIWLYKLDYLESDIYLFKLKAGP